jgi:hypothetical protein
MSCEDQLTMDERWQLMDTLLASVPYANVKRTRIEVTRYIVELDNNNVKFHLWPDGLVWSPNRFDDEIHKNTYGHRGRNSLFISTKRNWWKQLRNKDGNSHHWRELHRYYKEIFKLAKERYEEIERHRENTMCQNSLTAFRKFNNKKE